VQILNSETDLMHQIAYRSDKVYAYQNDDSVLSAGRIVAARLWCGSIGEDRGTG
jgi:hypothetical protein